MNNQIRFASLNIDKNILKALDILHTKPLSMVEAKVIPLLLKNKSVIAVSETGTGKTFSYVIPLLSRLAVKGNQDPSGIKSIVIIPTNVLGFQVENVFKKIIDLSGLTSLRATFYSSVKEVLESKVEPDIAIITPFLFKALLKAFNLKNLESIVFDEGDMILFDGFYEEMKEICNSLPKAKKSFFSASLAEQFLMPVKKICKADEIIDCTQKGINGENIKHVWIDARDKNRLEALKIVLQSPDLSSQTGILFVSKLEEIYEMKKVLEESKKSFAIVTGNMDKRTIANNLKAFKDNKISLLLATDYASRGLDMPYVQFVLSYDLPKDLNFYFHRAGRTGRFNAKGTSYIIATPEDAQKAKELVRRGVHFSFAAIKKDGMVSITAKPKSHLSSKNKEDYIEKAVFKAKLKNPKIVKPGYKKKIKTAIAIAKNKHKKKIIRVNLSKKNNTYGNH